MHKILFYNKFISYLYMFRATCAHRQEIKIVLYSLWYHHTYRWPSRAQVAREDYTSPTHINPLAPELFFLILAHPIYKM